MTPKSLAKWVLARAAWSTGIPQRIEKVRNELSVARRQASHVDKGTQILLGIKYRELAARGEKLPFTVVEFRNHSQNGEDGILWYILSLIGSKAAVCVEMCAGDGTECNTANLILNHGWRGLLVDGNEDRVRRGLDFYLNHPDTRTCPPSFVRAWVTAEGVNRLLEDQGFAGEVDVLSLDLDGVDYWIWKAIECIAPRVVVAEVQCIWGPEATVTVPYAADFRSELVQGFGIYSGASLGAFCKLAAEKGYRLIGVEHHGFNAFFLRNDIGADLLPTVSVAECLDKPFVKWATRKFLPLVKDMEWVTV